MLPGKQYEARGGLFSFGSRIHVKIDDHGFCYLHYQPRWHHYRGAALRRRPIAFADLTPQTQVARGGACAGKRRAMSHFLQMRSSVTAIR
jgi:hypothetical protein